ncbi:hypothetical protein CBR_g37457 [Chara braunii]|uniref:Deoxyuridine 5'-triphosphate nucleotidohydrolase n=1 Tax=Chara braunii TaxID=69332 RepID=A0A388LN42_CHABU|nr:hypothetical protein CBR_g37457 [Chara braunii]|eukprot:GBG83655.1 hypothetical protein CBR_g37457 [Chara braunii]
MESAGADVQTSQAMEVSMTVPPKVDVEVEVEGEVVASVVSDSAPRQPHGKVQKIESKDAEGKAVEIPSAASDALHLGPQINGGACGGNIAIAKEVGVASASALRVKKLSEHAILPSRGTTHSAGYDLASAYDCVVPARGTCLVKTDLSIAIPLGTYARIAPRSGLALKKSIDVGGGVVDYDYRGPVGVILFNHSDEDLAIQAGDRVAQLILERIVTPDVVEVEDLDETERGDGGFGSTGLATTS